MLFRSGTIGIHQCEVTQKDVHWCVKTMLCNYQCHQAKISHHGDQIDGKVMPIKNERSPQLVVVAWFPAESLEGPGCGHSVRVGEAVWRLKAGEVLWVFVKCLFRRLGSCQVTKL